MMATATHARGLCGEGGVFAGEVDIGAGPGSRIRAGLDGRTVGILKAFGGSGFEGFVFQDPDGVDILHISLHDVSGARRVFVNGHFGVAEGFSHYGSTVGFFSAPSVTQPTVTETGSGEPLAQAIASALHALGLINWT